MVGFNPVPKPKWKKLSSHKTKIQQCENVWRFIIRSRAGFKSEINEKHTRDNSILECHHILGKNSIALRFSLDNGICLADFQHRWSVSLNQNERIYLENEIAKVRGANFKEDIRERLNGFKTIDEHYDFLIKEADKYGWGKV